MSTIQAADLETGLHSMENRILSLVISTRLCLNQQLAVVVVKPKFYFKQIPHMLCVTAVSSWRKALRSSGWDYKQVMGFKVLLIPALEAHELPLIRQGENFMEKQFWRSREGCETWFIGEIFPGQFTSQDAQLVLLDHKHHGQASSAKTVVADADTLQWVWLMQFVSQLKIYTIVLRQEFVWFWWWQLSFALPV